MDMKNPPQTITQSESLRRLDESIEEALRKCLPQQVKFCIAHAAGESREKSYMMSGYKNKYPREAGNRLMAKPHIKEAVKLLRKRYALENGVGASWKRQRIIDAINLAEELKQPNTMVSGVRLLAEMDQDIGGITTAGGIEITIVTGVDRGSATGIDRGVTIENK